MSNADKKSRRFPRLAWAWPEGGRNQLVKAAICPDDDRAINEIEAWLRNTDLDDATFAEHRLLAAITTRFDARLAHHPEYARLCGMQRLNWTRSRMAIAATRPVLEEMVEAGLRVILLKGACRVALDMTEQKSRTSYDLDLLLGPGDFEKAFEILASDGWASTRGESAMGLRARLSSVRARNFKKGRFGDIDLHRFAYHTSSSDPQWDAQFFEDLQHIDFYGLKVFIPGTEERLAMAIGHGGWDGQSHSDWLVDVARILEKEPVDFEKFAAILKGRRLRGAAAIALSYLAREVGLDLPDELLHRAHATTDYAKVGQFPALLLAKDAERLLAGQKLARRLVVGYEKLWHSGRSNTDDAPVFRAMTRSAKDCGQQGLALRAPITTAALRSGTYSFAILIEVPSPSRSRRLEFEINSEKRNLCHLQAMHWRRQGANVGARFKGRVTLTEGEGALTLEALPGKLIEDGPGSMEYEKYAAVPFVVKKAEFSLVE